MIASVETVEAIDNLITDWWSIEQLYETAAKFASVFVDLLGRKVISDEDYKVVRDMYEQHLMMAGICKVREKGGE